MAKTQQDLSKLYTIKPENPDNPEGVRQYFQRIIDAMPNNVYWLNRECITMGCNHNTLRLLGLTRLEDFVGLTYEKMAKLGNWTEDQAQSFKQDDMEVMATGRPKYNVEEPPLYDEKGNPVYYLSSRVPLFDENNNVVGVLGISVDITEKKKFEQDLLLAKEQANAANQAKTEFIANVSHDIRTPLTGMIGVSEALLKQVDTASAKESARDLIAASHQLLTLLNEVIELVQIDNETLPHHNTTFDIRDIFKKVAQLLRPSLSNKKLALRVNAESNIPDALIGDSVRLHRIILNLASNAIKFTESGHVEINAYLAKKEGNAYILKLDIADTGIGIPKDKQSVIFSRFSRLNPSYNSHYQGAGLGLAIAKQFVDDLGGELYVDSEVGKGTCFTCIIPFKKPLLDDSKNTMPHSSSSMENLLVEEGEHLKNTTNTQSDTLPNTHHYSILLVEDNKLAQKMAKNKLEELGCDVDAVGNGEDALEKAKSAHRYDLIFMDIGLPGMDGCKTTEKIRALKAHQETPIIALTAHANKKNKEQYLSAGMDTVLNKPLTTDVAIELFTNSLSKKQKQ